MFEGLKKHWRVLKESWSAESESRKTTLKI